MFEHVIMNKVGDRPVFRLQGDGGPGKRDCEQMRFDMSTRQLEAGALGTLFSSAAADR